MNYWSRRSIQDGRESGARKWLQIVLVCAATFGLNLQTAQAQTCASTAVTKGYRDFNFGSTVYNLPTAEKPEHKLWWNDDFWWGSLWDPSANKYRIHRFNLSSQCWTSVGPDIDDRSQSLADALWDGSKLYIASHISELTSATGNGRLYRYSYNSSTDTYSLDSGFPVDVNSDESETLTLTKDGTGKLWVTWVSGSNVMVNHSTTSDANWAAPFQLPVQGASAGSDDISAIVQLNNRVGILWSNQNDKKMYFATHVDGASENSWQARETALQDGSKPVADDHINLKLLADGSGNIYAATKSSTSTSSETLIYLLKRDDSGNWSSYEVAKESESHTRPILALDSENRMIYVFLARLSGSPRCIYRKSTSMDNIQFAAGVGDEFIKSTSDDMVNNPTSTRQNVNSTTGILILASDENTHYYLHGYMSLASGGSNQPPVANASANPQSGDAPLQVSFSSSGSNDPDGSIASYSWNFGDGNTSTSANPTHTYNAAGNYNAVLTVTDNQGATGTNNVSITVSAPSNQSPVAMVSANPQSGEAPLLVSFSSAGSNDPDGSIASYSWSFGDGNSATDANPSHTYNAAGNYDAVLTVTDNLGATANASVNISVSPAGGGQLLTFNPTDDTQANSSNPSSNYASLTTFRVRNGSPTYNSYLKFDVAGLTGTVVRATLRLFVGDDGPDGGTLYSISNNYAGTSTPWVESGLNWSNAPALSGTPITSLGTVPLNTWIEINVTSAITGNGTFSFGLNSNSTNSVYYTSKEQGTYLPELIVESVPGSGNQAPTAAASATPQNGDAPLQVSFSSTGSNDPDGSISSYAWNFGDGNSSSDENPTHTYNSAGNYTAVLTVTDNQGATGTDNVAITVNASGPTPPAAPSSLSATAVSTSQINLSWADNSGDEDGFKIERKTGANGTYAEIISLGSNATSYSNTGLAAGTNYVYRVLAFNAGGNSAYSNEASATTQGGSGNVNLALNQPAAAMTSDASYPPSRANDGNASNYWRSGSVSGSSPTNWWRVDLGASQTVARIVVKWKDSYFAKMYDIQISNDDVNYTTVHANDAGAKGTQDISFAPSSARYVRIYMRANQKSNYRIFEFEVYASGSLGKGLAGAEENDAVIPAEIALEQNYPNPFNPNTNIAFALTEEAHVTLRVYDMLGAKVATLVNGVRKAGRHIATFDASRLPTGSYYYVLQIGETRLVRRLSFVK